MSSNQSVLKGTVQDAKNIRYVYFAGLTQL